ncbi:uncharacterized protein sll0103, partial [Phtheirospermum japonicum]
CGNTHIKYNKTCDYVFVFQITCAICKGQDKDLEEFTAKCSHSFHLRCIAQKVYWDGGYLCPVCGATMNDLPSLTKYYAKPAAGTPDEPLQFSDDEPLPADTTTAGQAFNAAGLQNVVIRAVPEHDAVAASEPVPNFSVLVGLRAPPLSADARRAPIDLVTVLDVSSSMHFGSKLDLVKRAVSFVIDNLGPSDRLSLVCFSTSARRVFPLRMMTEQGRADAKRDVNSLRAYGVHRNPVASIMFLSDGRDTYNRLSAANNQQQTIPVHVFGFGTDHDPIVMHAIADSSGGTFSFIESAETVQDAFARCIGGLLSVLIQELRLSLRSASHGVVIKSIPSGKHASEISDQGSRGTITVGDLYADEEKEFLVNISVPVYMDDNIDENVRTTSLLDITGSYKDVLSNERVQMEFVEIRRPGVPSPSDVKVKLEVDRQRNRLDAAEGFAEAQRVAETGDLKGARAILSSKRSSLLASASGQAGDGFTVKLEAEMKETEETMGCKRTYEQTGRAYALSNISAHANQRATTRRRIGSGSEGPPDDAYETPNMANMVNKSQQLIKIEEDAIKKEEY